MVDDIQSTPITRGLIVEKAKVAEGGEYNLSGERYRVGDMRPSNYPQVKLSDVCEINPEVKRPSDLYAGSYFDYIDISCVENESGRFLGANRIETDNAPSRARRSVIKKRYSAFYRSTEFTCICHSHRNTETSNRFNWICCFAP